MPDMDRQEEVSLRVLIHTDNIRASIPYDPTDFYQPVLAGHFMLMHTCYSKGIFLC